MGRSKRWAAIVATVLSLGLLAGCGSKPASQAGSGESGKAGEAKAVPNFPTKPITILVPFAAGGAADLMSRTLAGPAGEKLGQPVVVENRPGGSGAVAMTALKNAPPDGYTLIMTSTGPSTITPVLSDTGYGPQDFVPIMQVTDIPLGLAVPNDSPLKSVQDFFKFASENPNKLKVGTPGATLVQHITLQQLLAEQGVKVNLVPFNGGAESVTAMLGGNVDAIFNVTQELMPHVKAGRFRLLGVTAAERLEEAPDVPTFREQNLDVVKGAWYGLVAPKGTPADVVKKLHDAFKAALDSEKVQEEFKKLHVPPGYTPGEALAERWAREFENNKQFLKK